MRLSRKGFFYFSFIILLQLKSSSPQKIRQLNDWGYSFHKQLATFDEAGAICSEKNGFLAHTKDDSTLIFLKDQLLSYQVINGSIENFLFWIGLNQISNEYPEWKWTDNHPLVTGESHYNWFTGQPDGIKKKCVGMTYSISVPGSFGKWFNKDCSSRLSFICQYQMEPRCSKLGMIIAFFLGSVLMLICLAFWRNYLRKSTIEKDRKKRKSKRSKEERPKEDRKSARQVEMISNIHNF